MFQRLKEYHQQIAELCQRYRVKRLELFGSAARHDFDLAQSDIDFLVEFENLGWKGSSAQYFGFLHGLEDLLHRKVDLVERDVVRNPYFLEVADQHRELLYAA
ncbi:MAG TPA: nucleotidyltransferase domain-containing protein [Tepidisphaeraceae bacterium]|jgi:hypothetical protein